MKDLKGHLLYAEDSATQRYETVEFLENDGWQVTGVADGEEALSKLQEGSVQYDCMILDLKMPNMGGLDLLKMCRDKSIKVPEVVVISGYLNAKSIRECAELGVRCLLKKSVDLEVLSVMAEASVELGNHLFCDVIESQDKTVTLQHDTGIIFVHNMSENELSSFEHVTETKKRLLEGIRIRENHLKRHFIEATSRMSFPTETSEPVLVVCRRWNSWYPSFFTVDGGAYAVVGPTDNLGQHPVAVIDPGFRAIAAMKGVGLSPASMSSCVITHNHADHIAGIFEYLALRSTLSKDTTLFCNPSSFRMMRHLADKGLMVNELSSNESSLLQYELLGGKWQSISIRAVNTAHEEVGPTNESRGIVLVSRHGDAMTITDGDGWKVVILGDTQYRRSQDRDPYMKLLNEPNIKAVVLHIGSAQYKASFGKHLYFLGLSKILGDLDSNLEASGKHGRLLVLISEWGLEHATRLQMRAISEEVANEFDDTNPIIQTVSLLQENLNKIRLLPADIGLTVGMESGLVYLEERQVSPEDVKFRATASGLEYFC